VRENKKRFTLSKPVNKRLEILPTAFVLDKDQPNQYLVPVYNNSTNDIFIKNDTKLSSIEFVDGSICENNIVDVNFLDIYNMDQYFVERKELENTKLSQENNDIFSPHISSIFLNGEKTLENQKAFNEQEKNDLLKSLHK